MTIESLLLYAYEGANHMLNQTYEKFEGADELGFDDAADRYYKACEDIKKDLKEITRQLFTEKDKYEYD